MILYGHTEAVATWVASRIPMLGGAASFGPCHAIGIVRGNDLAAGGVLHNWMPDFGSAEFSFASATPRWVRWADVAELLRYPFMQLGVWRLWAATAVENDRARRFAKAAGFYEEGPLRDYYGPGKPAVILSMTLPEYSARFERLH